MDESIQPLAAETEAIKEAYAALNRNDIPGFAQILDPQIERIEPAEFPSGGTYHGLAAVKAHVSKGRSTWAEGSCEPERFIVAGDKIVVFLHVRVRLKDNTEWVEAYCGRLHLPQRQGHPVPHFRRRTAGARMGGTRRFRCKLTRSCKHRTLQSRPRIAWSLWTRFVASPYWAFSPPTC